MSYLNMFDSADEYNNFFCEKASERIGDYYRAQHDYLKAIAYYDSADTKYRDKLQFCGNAYYIDFIPRRYKVSQCYSALKDLRQAILILTPYVFDSFSFSYFDSAMTLDYLNTLSLLYSKQEIQKMLNNAIDDVKCNYYFLSSLDSNNVKYMKINGAIKIFDTAIEVSVYAVSPQHDGQISTYVLKELWTQQFKELEIYKRLEN